MAQYIHVIRDTFQPIPRASQSLAFEDLQATAADNYNATNGVAENRIFLLVDRPERPGA